MASYHCTVKVGGKGKAAAHAAYIAREGKYSGRDRYEDLEASASGNMPKWAEHNPAHFWSAADEHERANGATYREIEVALPRELTPQQRRALVEDFIQQELGDRHAYQWAIHTPTAAIEKGEQPHAHIMYSERLRDGIDRDPEQYFKRYNAKTPERGGCRKDSAGTEERLQATRERWASVQNAHLARHGHSARVDHRSLKAQGIDREPEKHIGPSRVKDMQPQDVAALLTRRAAEGELERAQRQVSSLIDLSCDLAAAKAEREQEKQRREAAQKAASVSLLRRGLLGRSLVADTPQGVAPTPPKVPPQEAAPAGVASLKALFEAAVQAAPPPITLKWGIEGEEFTVPRHQWVAWATKAGVSEVVVTRMGFDQWVRFKDAQGRELYLCGDTDLVAHELRADLEEAGLIEPDDKSRDFDVPTP